MRWFLLGCYVLLPSLALAQVQHCTITREDKLVCPPSTTSVKNFRARVVSIPDNSTIEVEYEGRRLKLRFFSVPGISQQDVAAVAGQQEVMVIVKEREKDGSIFGDAILANGQALRNALMDHMRQKEVINRQEAGRKYAAEETKKVVIKPPPVPAPVAPRETSPRIESPLTALSNPPTAITESKNTTEVRDQWDLLCKSFGESGYQVVLARNRGVPLTTGLATVDQYFQGRQSSILIPLYRQMIIEIYEQRWMDATSAQQHFELVCTKARN